MWKRFVEISKSSKSEKSYRKLQEKREKKNTKQEIKKEQPTLPGKNLLQEHKLNGMAAVKRRLCLSGESVNTQQFLKDSLKL